MAGSQALPDSLVRLLHDHGGTVVCSALVDSIEVSGGRATAVRTSDGRRFGARLAVVSSAHLARLGSMLTGWKAAADLTDAAARWRPGLAVFAVHAALRNDLRYRSADGAVPSVAAGYGSASGMARQVEAHWNGVADATDPWLLVVDQTVVDPERAPGRAATFKILTIAPYERSDGRTWADTKDAFAADLLEVVRSRAIGLEEQDILALHVESPVDVAGHNVHNLGGSCHGGEFSTADGGVIPGWPSYRTSIEGLFLTGATTHPGGSVSGRPGRNAARAVLGALGIDPGIVMGPD